jgi:uncharacterized membrane protein YphA (DoxX/SURF4 family)
MNDAKSWLWVAQIALALGFLAHGLAMLSLPEAARASMAYMWDIPPQFRTFIGVAEVLAAVGLILPTLTGILRWLTPLAAMGLIVVMLGAIGFHTRRGEFRNLILNLILFLVAAFVVFELWLNTPVR